jgi:PAS domain S-box-containing protein
MSESTLKEFATAIDLFFPAEWVKAALVLALFTTWVVIGLFAYLNHYTKKAYFSLWTVAWMFYAVWLAACIGLEESPYTPFLVMARRACIGISALFMFWGSFQLTYGARNRRELGMGVILIVIWSYVAAYKVVDRVWITIPVFVLLAAASVYTGLVYFRFGKRYRGAHILAAGFVLWGFHLLGFPFQEMLSPSFVATGYVTSSILSLLIAMGMVVQVLEQARERNETLLEEFKKGIATRRLLEQEVTVSEQKYQALFESASDAIFLVDLETLEVLEANQSAERLTNRNAPELIGRSYLDLCPDLKVESKSLLENKKAFETLFGPSAEFQMVRSNGAHVTCEGSANLVQYNKRPVLQINVREITERKEMETQLRRGEKLSALGQLIAGVAHELNNPLAVIMGYSQIMTKQRSMEARAKTDMLKILHESERAAKIVRNLLTFARPREPQMSVVDINRLVNGVLTIHDTHLQGGDIELVKRLAPNLPKTKADPNQIEQVVTNLVTNAIQALMSHAGARKLEISTEIVNSAIRIAVADSGPGIQQDIITKIFDPFFTTKAPGKGTGLGLSISYSIVEEHRGRIWVQSQCGKGAKFFVELPIVACPDALDIPEPVAAEPTRDPQATQRRLLIVDDEPGIVEVLKEVLGGSGYLVETATNGADALNRISAGRFDLIISDLCMPEVDGQKLYKTVRDAYPNLAKRIIFVTGDTVSSNSRAFLEWTGNRWFSKPFNIREIEQVVGNFLRQDETSLVAANC